MSDHHDKIGAALRDARQACGLSLDEVAERIHIRPVYLQAIEAGQFELLPAIPQRLGFTRCYAGFLQIDLGDDLDKLSEEVNDRVSQTDYSAPALLLPDTRRGWGMYGVAAVLMALVAGSVFYFSGTQTGDVAATNAPQTSVPPAKASLPVLEDKAQSPATNAVEPDKKPASSQAPSSAEDSGEAPVATDLAERDDASAPAAIAAPVIAADAHAAATDNEPQADEAHAEAPVDEVPAVKMATAETKAVSAAPDAAEANEVPATKVEASKVEAKKVEAGDAGASATAASEGDRAALQPAYLASSDVFIRAQPDNGGAVLGVVNRCEPLQVLGGNRYWREVEREDGTKGWVFTDYVAQRGKAGCV